MIRYASKDSASRAFCWALPSSASKLHDKMRLTHPTNQPATAALWSAVFATFIGIVVPQFAFLLGTPVGLAAVVFGIIGIVRAKSDGGRSLAILGLVLGLVGPIGALGVWLLSLRPSTPPAADPSLH
jgi:hypothetical protein